MQPNRVPYPGFPGLFQCATPGTEQQDKYADNNETFHVLTLPDMTGKQPETGEAPLARGYYYLVIFTAACLWRLPVLI